jgi:probable blue pigment (indigoidine) exporter
MSHRTRDLLLTALAPAIWGSTYIVTTELLPQVPPMTVALLRALPAGLLLLLAARRLPQGIWWLRVFILGALNFSVFWSLLFVSAYRLPGGAAATVGAVQPLVVVFLAAAVLGSAVRPAAVLGALAGLAGVALLVLTPGAALDATGIAAGLAGARRCRCAPSPHGSSRRAACCWCRSRCWPAPTGLRPRRATCWGWRGWAWWARR